MVYVATVLSVICTSRIWFRDNGGDAVNIYLELRRDKEEIFCTRGMESNEREMENLYRVYLKYFAQSYRNGKCSSSLALATS